MGSNLFWIHPILKEQEYFFCQSSQKNFSEQFLVGMRPVNSWQNIEEKNPLVANENTHGSK